MACGVTKECKRCKREFTAKSTSDAKYCGMCRPKKGTTLLINGNGWLNKDWDIFLNGVKVSKSGKYNHIVMTRKPRKEDICTCVYPTSSQPLEYSPQRKCQFCGKLTPYPRPKTEVPDEVKVIDTYFMFDKINEIIKFLREGKIG
jgi:hypothetical protein